MQICPTPMSPLTYFDKDENGIYERRYRGTFSNLLYLNASRLDIIFRVSISYVYVLGINLGQKNLI